MSEIVNDAKEVALKGAELTAEELVEKCFDPAIDLGVEAAKEKLPDVADAILVMVVAALRGPAKAALLAQIEKISKEV